jgi:hypothetical protein
VQENVEEIKAALEEGADVNSIVDAKSREEHT